MYVFLKKKMEGVYVYLPSSVKPIWGNNRNNSYTTRLAERIELEDSLEYECAMIKMVYPSDAWNIYNGKVSFKDEIGTIKTVNIISEKYETPDDFIEAYNSVLGKIMSEKYLLKFKDKKFTLKISNGTTSSYINFSKNIQIFTGLNENYDEEGMFTGKNDYDILGGIDLVYTYCSLVKYTRVGDSLVPVISIHQFQSGKNFGKSHQTEYSPIKPIYLPLNTRLIDTIKIDIRTETGMFFPFVGRGEVLILLHIRPRKF